MTLNQLYLIFRIFGIIILFIFLEPQNINAALSGKYYIDATNGNDLASGKTEIQAWKTFNRINSTTLTAGTNILLKRGEVWNQRLEIRGAGTVNNWIIVGAYGAGNVKPKISLTNNKDDIALLISDLDKTTGIARQQNISYIEINDLEISNTRLGIYYRTTTGTTNTGFRVKNITFNNINCDEVMHACNTGVDKKAKLVEVYKQLQSVKGNLQTINGAADGGGFEYIFPAAIFVGGQTFGNQRVSGNHTTVLTELEVDNCQFNEAIAGVMSVFYWPFVVGMGADAWRQIVHKVRVTNCVGTGSVNGMIAFDGVNGGAIPDSDFVMHPDENGWGLMKNVQVLRGASSLDRTWPDGTTGAILSNAQNFLVDSCEFSDILNQGNPDGCGFDFETNNHQVTIQNTKFINNDGHAILLTNSGPFGPSTHLTVQKNLFAKNVKYSTSLSELEFSDGVDGHTDIKVRDNVTFLRKLNKNNLPISFFNPNRMYIIPSGNEVYLLDDSAQSISINFLEKPYTFNATISSVSSPIVKNITVNNATIFVDNQQIILNTITTGNANFYKVSEKSDFSDAIWNVYSSNTPFSLTPNDGLKTIYYKVRNLVGESEIAKIVVALKTSPAKMDATNRLHPSFIKVTPNPVMNAAKIKIFKDVNTEDSLNWTVNKLFELTVYTIDGIVMDQKQVNINNLILDTSKYPKGQYVVRLVDVKDVYSTFMIK